MKKLCIFLSIILAGMLIISTLSVGAFAIVGSYGNGESVDKSILTGNQTSEKAYVPNLEVCSNMGNWQKYAENSVEAIRECKTAYISVDVKLTKDGVPVLMADDTLDRMCVDSTGKTVSGVINEMNYDEMSTYFLRFGNGGELSKKSDYTIATLEQSLSALYKDTTMIIDVSTADLGKVAGVIENKEMLSRVLFRLTDADSRDVVSIVTKNSQFKNLIIPQYNGNIIFSANSLLRDAADAKLTIVKVGTKNRNGVVLYDAYTSKFHENNIKAMFSMVDEYAAGRSDDITGWDNIISHGYSIIETDYPDLLTDYIESTNELRTQLISLLTMCEDYLKGEFSKESLENLTTAFNTAKKYTTGVASQSQLSGAIYDLTEAYNNLQPSSPDEVTGKFTFSVGRLIAVVLCGGAFVASQLYLYKKRKK